MVSNTGLTVLENLIGTNYLAQITDLVKNNVGKGENTDYQHLLLFPYIFPSQGFIHHGP